MQTDYQTHLSDRYAADILSMVYENESIMATDMLKIAKNYKTAIKTANMLIDLGLLEMEIVTGRRQMKIYRLTEKGKPIGQRMFECRKILLGMADS